MLPVFRLHMVSCSMCRKRTGKETDGTIAAEEQHSIDATETETSAGSNQRRRLQASHRTVERSVDQY